MQKITSFEVDHNKLLKGIYVSSKNNIKDIVLTIFDIRIKLPNREPVMNIAELHTLEHLGASLLRNNEVWKEKVIYWGPMGCRTGFYLILEGDYKSSDIIDLMVWVFEEIIAFKGAIPGASNFECGNYREHNIDMAKYEAKIYLKTLKSLKSENLNYPN